MKAPITKPAPIPISTFRVRFFGAASSVISPSYQNLLCQRHIQDRPSHQEHLPILFQASPSSGWPFFIVNPSTNYAFPLFVFHFMSSFEYYNHSSLRNDTFNSNKLAAFCKREARQFQSMESWILEDTSLIGRLTENMAL